MEGLLKDFGNLGPALGSVVAIGLICWKLLDMIDKQGKSIAGVMSSVSKNMEEHTRAMASMSENVAANTKTTDRLASIMERKLKEV